ncbi:cuticle protein 19.8-like isoform X2 [Penaeus japonicus]|uniref:cuticle protein 19.8-like isoform X1 n=1 Tax=Penaeus japonicus TaxID=27405 RepID=UPI001C7155CD|nr:cuticle protein 19.8-like isoform X1 [Penaeus japonicus]XP_042881574.1 cuticle protein 19.8-like isoform X2 [Penaeus japonicus]
MNALTVISVAALVASGSTSLLAYNGVYGGHHGLLGAYPYAGYSGLHPYAYTGALPAAAPLTLKTPVVNTVAPAPVSYNVAPAPVSYNVAPYAPVAPIQSQYHAQDEIGQYSFGYAGGPSSRAESRDAFGVVRGSYNYVDSEGKVQTQHYVADALGFRVSGTNLPVAPDAPVVAPLAALPGPLPEPVQDTPEVAAAKAAHQQAYDEAAAAAAAAPDTRKKRSVLAAPGLGVYSPLRFSYGFSTPLHYGQPAAYPSPLHYTAAHPALTTYNAAHVPTTYAAATGPALRDAELLRVVHNPGHATSYRVLN